jgi:uncharacterized protein YggE
VRRITVIAIVAASALLAACTPAVTVENTESGSETASGIAVSGTGEVYGTPDTLQMRFGVSVLRPTVEQAVGDAAGLAEGLISSLESAGVAEADIQTANYSINPEYDYSGDQRRLIGYRVDNTVIAKIRDLDSAGSVIDATVASVGDEIQVSGVSFSIEDDTELIAAARAAAWDDARTKAEQLATLAGIELGEAVMISESFSSPAPLPVYRDFAATDEAVFETPIEAGQQQVAVTLQVRFATS